MNESPEALSTSEKIRAFDTERRDQAAAAGMPLRRAFSPALSTAFHFLVACDAAGNPTITSLMAAEQSTRPLTLQDVKTIIGDPLPSPFMIDQRATLLAVRRMVAKYNKDNYGDFTYRGTARQLDLIETLPIAPDALVLADELAFQFWLPSGLDTRNIHDWARAFGTTPAKIVEAVRTQNPAPSTADERTWKSARFSASKAIESAKYSGTSSACSVFDSLEALGSLHGAMLASQWALAERNALTGVTSALRILHTTHTTFTASYSEPFKVKVGESVTLMIAGQPFPSKLTALRSGTDEMVGVFALGSEGVRNAVETARANYEGIYVARQPFTARNMGIKSDWAGDITKAKPHVKRNVPLDVIIAGTVA